MECSKEASSLQRKILVINPNSNQEVTDRTQKTANKVLTSGCEALVLHPESSPLSIETLAHRKVAEPLALDLLSQHQGYDGYVMACFDDIAIKAARRFLKVPVVDTVEASIAIARLYESKFTIVTTVESMVPGIKALVETLGASDHCSVRAAGIGVANAAAGEPEALKRLDETIVKARNIDGAKVIILGSGGLTGQAERLTQVHGIPIIDCIEAGIRMADMASNLRFS